MQLILFLLLFSFFQIQADSQITIITDKVFLTPNYDGKNDFMKFQINSTSDKKISDWVFILYDESGKLVKSFQADKRHENRKNFITRFFVKDEEFLETEIILPKEIFWLGNDNSGKQLSDGRYSYQLKVYYFDKTNFQTKLTTVYLDTIAPYSRLTSENKFFTPNNDKVLDSVSIKQEIISEPNDRWIASFINENNISVKTYTWDSKTIPKIITWDGKDDRGILQSEGIYKYVLTGEDFSENKFTNTLDNIYLSKSISNSDIQTNISSFSPDGDKLKDKVLFKIISLDKNISNWEAEIFSMDKEKKEVHISFQGNSTQDLFEWDGKNQNGKVLSNGIYFYNAKFYSKEKTFQSPTRKIEINLTAKSIRFDLSSKKFTPDGDNQDDILEIFPYIENLFTKTWKLSLIQNYKVNNVEKKIVFKKWRGIGNIADKILWDGYSDSGVLINSLADLELHFSFRNELNEIKFYKVKSFNTGMLINSNLNKLRVSVPEYIFKEDESEIISSFKSIIKKFPGYKVEIQSHSKQLGNNLENMSKTEVRAKSIYKRIIGIEKDIGRFTYRGFGEVEPFFTDDNDYKQERNDRIDILFIEPKTISR